MKPRRLKQINHDKIFILVKTFHIVYKWCSFKTSGVVIETLERKDAAAAAVIPALEPTTTDRKRHLNLQKTHNQASNWQATQFTLAPLICLSTKIYRQHIRQFTFGQKQSETYEIRFKYCRFKATKHDPKSARPTLVHLQPEFTPTSLPMKWEAKIESCFTWKSWNESNQYCKINMSAIN